GQHGCTPPGVDPPPPSGRRRLVLVAGLASTSEGAGIDAVDSAALGYARADVVRFSYRGGTTAEQPYDADDTQVDIRTSGRRLRQLLERLHAEDPDVPVDVVAHSQGGLVARSALGPRAPPGVATLVTLGTPHHGADLATALARIGTTPKGALAEAAVGASDLTGIDPTSTSVGQLAETSRYIRELNAVPLPAGVRVTSIAAVADVVVPSPRSRLGGAANVVVAVPGLNHHSDLPGSPAAQREVALALAGLRPTCRSMARITVDVLAGEAISVAEDVAGLGLASLTR
ncbi:MAG: lipase family alpha/beta hydrolase, partial [Acidimicrobiales bacterium]